MHPMMDFGLSIVDGAHPWQLHYLSATRCAAPVTFGSELLLLAVGLLRVLPTVCCVCEGNEINTKIRVADGGFAFAWMVVPTVGKRVFLPAVSTISTVMRCISIVLSFLITVYSSFRQTSLLQVLSFLFSLFVLHLICQGIHAYLLHHCQQAV